MSDQSPIEHEIIFNLLASDSDPVQLERLVTAETDWEYIYRTAGEHRIIPLIYKNLGSVPAGLVPEPIFKRFRARYKEIAKFNFARSTQLIQLVKQLDGEDLPVIAYKGMALAEFAYRDTTLRQFGDIDLFIRKKDFYKARELFIQIGCRPVWNLSASQERAVLKYHYEYPFYFGENDTLIELHWGFVESFFTFDFETEPKIWDRTALINLYGRPIRTLAAEDYLIVLGSHGSKHFWKRLSWVCDIAKLIENREINWDTVIRRAARHGSLRMVWLGAHLAARLVQTKLPAEISRMISADRHIKPLAERFLKTMFAEEKEPAGWVEMARLHLNMRENLGIRLKYSYRLLTTKAIDSLFMPMGRPR